MQAERRVVGYQLPGPNLSRCALPQLLYALFTYWSQVVLCNATRRIRCPYSPFMSLLVAVLSCPSRRVTSSSCGLLQ